MIKKPFLIRTVSVIIKSSSIYIIDKPAISENIVQRLIAICCKSLAILTTLKMTRNSLATMKTAKTCFRKCIYTRFVPVLKNSCPVNYRRLFFFLLSLRYMTCMMICLLRRGFSWFFLSLSDGIYRMRPSELNVKIYFNSC